MIRSSGVHEYYKFRSLYVIQNNKYSIPVNVIITGQVLICQEASDKSCHNKKQVSSSKSGVR